VAKRVVAVEAKPVNPRKKGLEKVTFRLEPAQIETLQREAFRRAEERGSLKPDSSELVREALAAWFAKSAKR